MIFIWRGFGLAVPIVFFLSAWITSYWFQDTRLLNAAYIGWSMLWAGLGLILFALASFGEKLDENGQPTGEKAYNDFFWIPIWAWSLGFIIGSIYLIYTADPEPSSSDYSTVDSDSDSENYIADVDDDEEEIIKRRLYLYNCAADSMKIEITETKPDDGTNFDFYVQDNDYEFVSVEPDRYTVKMDDFTQKIRLKKTHKNHENDYDAAWLVLCAEVDLVLVDVTDLCRENVTDKDVGDITWEDKVIERFNGDDLIEPDLESKHGGEVKVVAPGYFIPQERDRRQSIYALLPIDRSLAVTEEFLVKKVKKVAVR